MFDLLKSQNETYQENHLTPFNACSNLASNSTDELIFKKNAVDENSLTFACLIWIFLLLASIQSFFEWKLNLLSEVNWWAFVNGHDIERAIKMKINRKVFVEQDSQEMSEMSFIPELIN